MIAKKRKGETELTMAHKGLISQGMNHAAQTERVAPEKIMENIAKGLLIIPSNINHENISPVGIGIPLRIKVNANIGNSQLKSCLSSEMEKLKIAEKYRADTVMDLSTGENINEIRKSIIEATRLPVGTVPIYQAAELKKDFNDVTEQDFLDIIELHASQGVDFITLHCGLLKEHIPLVKKRLTGIVSRGGALIAGWMAHHDRQNPLWTNFDKICDICRTHDVSLSLGDGLRPGCLRDASDHAQFAELEALGKLTSRAWELGVQVMIEGPGHVPFDQIYMNMKREKEICHGAPFYVLGPLVTDVAPGYDHITGAIGATMAAFSGADMLCYVTPREHLGLPDPGDVREGIIAFRIAAHAADVARGISYARDWDDEMSRARYDFQWERQFELAMDGEKARQMREKSLENIDEKYRDSEFCSMCGPKYCSMKISKGIK